LMPDLDMSTPFDDTDFMKSVGELIKTMGINTNPTAVFREFETLGMFELVSTKRGFITRFKWHLGKIVMKFSEATGIDVKPRFEFGPGDYEDNQNKGDKVVMWKGSGRGKF